MKKNVNVISFGRAAFSYSTVQSPFDMNVLGSFWPFPWGNYFTPGFECSQHTASRNIKYAQTLPSHGTNSHLQGFILSVLSDGASETNFLFPEKFRNSRQASVEPGTSRSVAERATVGPTRYITTDVVLLKVCQMTILVTDYTEGSLKSYYFWSVFQWE